jgi:hypothetical protein
MMWSKDKSRLAVKYRLPRKDLCAQPNPIVWYLYRIEHDQRVFVGNTMSEVERDQFLMDAST